MIHYTRDRQSELAGSASDGSAIAFALRQINTQIRRLRVRLTKKIFKNETGATMLEWTLLLAAIAIPSYVIFRSALALLIYQYHMITMLNSLPFP